MPLAPGVFVQEARSGSAPVAGVGTSTPAFIGLYQAQTPPAGKHPSKTLVFCANFTEFGERFPPLPVAAGQPPSADAVSHLNLMHAVFGFFQNGGTGCYVIRGDAAAALNDVLAVLATADNIQIVAAPGVTTKASVDAIATHCSSMKDRFAILDLDRDTAELDKITAADKLPYARSDYAAVYHPWLEVSSLTEPGTRFVPPSGHVAGVYARVDATRGVHKAPANEPIQGALGVKNPISASLQSIINTPGINCIRALNGNIRIWGARTLGADQNKALDGGDFTYVHVRRLFNFIRTSIERGTQYTVFEPNNPNLWANVTRSLSSFLLGLWEQGALFGTTPQAAFFVQCDEETNPPHRRAIGEMRARIGVNIVPTAEFVIFELGQTDPEKK